MTVSDYDCVRIRGVRCLIYEVGATVEAHAVLEKLKQMKKQKQKEKLEQEQKEAAAIQIIKKHREKQHWRVSRRWSRSRSRRRSEEQTKKEEQKQKQKQKEKEKAVPTCFDDLGPVHLGKMGKEKEKEKEKRRCTYSVDLEPSDEDYHWCVYGWECKLCHQEKEKKEKKKSDKKREKKQPKTDAYSECMETLRMLNCFAGETLREPDGKGIK